MDEAQIKFGDKIFAYGQMTDYDKAEELGLFAGEYNAVMGYMPVGGYYTIPQKTDIVDACMPGYVMEYEPSLASQTLFSKTEMIDVTGLLSLQSPILSGTKIWMPMP